MLHCCANLTKEKKKLYRCEKKTPTVYDYHFEFVFIYCDLHFKIR